MTLTIGGVEEDCVSTDWRGLRIVNQKGNEPEHLRKVIEHNDVIDFFE